MPTTTKPKLQVLRSAAGYYIGTLCPDGSPNSRDSGYYRTQAEAQAALDNHSYQPRLHP